MLDSGLGGLTAVRELLDRLPNEDIIYFGDTGRVPYGTRSRRTILSYARQDIGFLRSFDIKALIVACGTVSTVALESLSGEYDIPLIGVLRASAMKAASVSRNGAVGLIGTSATVGSGAYERALAEYNPQARLYSAACPLFVSLVENGRCHRGDIVIETVTKEYLAPLKDRGIDTLIMGCTHYPLLSGVIADFLGPGVTLINSGKEAAEHAAGILASSGALSGRERPGSQQYYVSDSVDSFTALASGFLDRELAGQVRYVEISASGEFMPPD